MPNEWENSYPGLDAGTDDAIGDLDDDDLINLDEYYYGTLPEDPDSDDDGYEDGHEIRMGSDPLDAESTPAQAIYLPMVLRSQ